MNGILALVGAAVLGVDVGWRPAPGGGLEYIVQIAPEQLEALKNGEDIVSDIPPELKNIRRYRLTVGRGQLPRLGAETATTSSDGTFRPNSSAVTEASTSDPYRRTGEPTPASPYDAPRMPGTSRYPEDNSQTYPARGTGAYGTSPPTGSAPEGSDYRSTDSSSALGGRYATTRDPFVLPEETLRSEGSAPRGFQPYDGMRAVPTSGYQATAYEDAASRSAAGRDLQMNGNQPTNTATQPRTPTSGFANTGAAQQPIQNYGPPPGYTQPPPANTGFGTPTGAPVLTTGNTTTPVSAPSYAAPPPPGATYAANPTTTTPTPAQPTPWFPLAVTIVGFFLSLGGNVWMYWNMADTRLKYRQLVSEFDSGLRPRGRRQAEAA